MDKILSGFTLLKRVYLKYWGILNRLSTKSNLLGRFAVKINNNLNTPKSQMALNLNYCTIKNEKIFKTR